MNVAGVLRSRVALARNGLWPGRRRSRRDRWAGTSVLLTLVFGALVFLAMTAMFDGFAAARLEAREAGGVLAAILLAAIVGLGIFDVHYAVTSLLLDSDLELLRRSPASTSELVLLKLLDAAPRTSALVMVLAVPAVLGFLSAYPPPPWAWVALPVLLAALWAIPLGLGVAFALLLLSRVPAARAREALGLLSTLLITVIWLINSFVAPGLVAVDDDLPGTLARRLAAGELLGALSPPHWAAHALVAAAEARPIAAIGWTALLALAGAASVATALWVAGLQLDQVMGKILVGQSSTRPARPRSRPRGSLSLTGAIVRKDALLLRRDWTVLTDVLAAVALWTLLPLLVTPIREVPPQLMVLAMLLAMTVGLGYEVAARSIPFERHGLAWMRLAPLAPGRWVRAKWLGTAMVSLPLVLVVSVAIAAGFRMPWNGWLEALVPALAALGLSLSLGLWTGSVFGDPNWTNPRAMLTLGGRLVAAFLIILQSAMWLGFTYLLDRFRDSLPPGASWWAPALFGGVLGAIVLSMAEGRVRRREWLD